MSKKLAEQASVPSLERGLDILEHLAASKKCVSFSAITRLLDASKPTVSRMLQVLIRRGYVCKNDADGLYRCGPRMAGLGLALPAVDRLRQEGVPLLDEVRSRTGATALLLYFDGVHEQAMAKSIDPAGPTMREVGQISDVDGLSPWDAILLDCLPAEASTHLIENAAAGRSLRRRAKDIRRIGPDGQVGFDDQQRFAHLRRLGAVIFDRQGSPVGMLGLGASPLILTDETLPHAAQLLHDTARRISAGLGWRANAME